MTCCQCCCCRKKPSDVADNPLLAAQRDFQVNDVSILCTVKCQNSCHLAKSNTSLVFEVLCSFFRCISYDNSYNVINSVHEMASI